MSNQPPCPQCKFAYTYENQGMIVCPECSFTWSPAAEAMKTASDELAASVVKDANGTVLADGDTVVITKGLKVKGASSNLKVGTRVKNIRLVEGDHNIDCNIDGFGAMKLKSEFVKKA